MKVVEVTRYTIDKVYDLNVVEFLNYLIYIRSWANVQAVIHKEENKKLKLR